MWISSLSCHRTTCVVKILGLKYCVSGAINQSHTYATFRSTLYRQLGATWQKSDADDGFCTTGLHRHLAESMIFSLLCIHTFYIYYPRCTRARPCFHAASVRVVKDPAAEARNPSETSFIPSLTAIFVYIFIQFSFVLLVFFPSPSL